MRRRRDRLLANANVPLSANDRLHNDADDQKEIAMTMLCATVVVCAFGLISLFGATLRFDRKYKGKLVALICAHMKL